MLVRFDKDLSHCEDIITTIPILRTYRPGNTNPVDIMPYLLQDYNGLMSLFRPIIELFIGLMT